VDEAARYSLARWKALTEVGAPFTRPWTDLTAELARQRVDPDGRLGELSGRSVLCLASGGGQQAIAFAFLGAAVSSLDLSPEQVERDRLTASRFGCPIDTHEGDMRDLSRFSESSFDIVWHGYSLGFVPATRPVFEQVRRVLRRGGTYIFWYANPFVLGLNSSDWTGDGYPLREPYTDGAAVTYRDEAWVAENAEAGVPPPEEYRHTLGRVIEELAALGFVLCALEESSHRTPQAQPGSWEHFTSIAPPWMRLWCILRPDVLPALVRG
jgi:SAM-dependent methyltransferase